MSYWNNRARDSSSRDGAETRYRYRSTRSLRSEEEYSKMQQHQRQQDRSLEEAPLSREDSIYKQQIGYPRVQPGYRAQISMTSFKSYPSLCSIREDNNTGISNIHCMADSRSDAPPLYQSSAYARKPTPPQEFAGPFADRNNLPINSIPATTEDSAPSMELSEVSGSSGDGGSISEVSWSADEKPHAYEQDMSCLTNPKSKAVPQSYKTIEASPGVHLRLRGADETHEAIRNDFYIPTECVCCTQTILCIQDADFVLCPDCKVIGPLREDTDFRCKSMGGVGLGFKIDTLLQYQNSI